MTWTIKQILNDLSQGEAGSQSAAIQQFLQSSAWANLPESAKDIFELGAEDLQNLSALTQDSKIESFLDEPIDENIITQLAAVMSRFGILKVLTAAAVNCQRERDNKQEWSLRWASYALPIYAVIRYVNRSHKKESTSK